MEGIAMKDRAFSVFAVAGFLLGLSIPISAHHGTSVFDMSKTLTMRGTVTEWDWSNPHCLLQFDVKNEDGQVMHWVAETQNPANMVDVGWGKASFKLRDEVTVTLVPAKNGKPFGRIDSVVLPSGKKLEASKTDVTANDSVGSPGKSKSGNYSKK